MSNPVIRVRRARNPQQEKPVQYQGSKRRIAKYILPIILEGREPDQWYVEPFVGGANAISEVNGLRLGADIHAEVICLYKTLQKGWLPPTEVSEEDYKAIQADPLFPALRGYVLQACSFGAMWNAGFARAKDDPNPNRRSVGAYNSMMRQLPKLKGTFRQQL
jgi:DNA adenine methylase